MPEEYYDMHFPHLKKEGFRRTSEPAYYNCVAYAVGDTTRRWWPGEYHPIWSDDYWPDIAPNEETIGAFVVAFETLGFERCADDALEQGFEKIAFYALPNAIIRHVAKQEKDGSWRSKLGSDEDIEHTLAGLEGPFYGQVVAFLRRVRKDS